MMSAGISQVRVVRALFFTTAAAARCRFSSVISSSAASTSSSSSSSSLATKRIVFLGTPECAALSLRVLLEASKQYTAAAATTIALGSGEKEGGVGAAMRSPASAASIAPFEIVAAVSQPPSKGKKNEEVHSAVCQEVAKSGLKIPVFTPESAKDDSFLAALEALNPDLCITAAYGNYLPKRFLKIPRLGTINIHPSMLPLYRGSAPVQRCLENGDKSTGISLLYTVLKMDAGPVIYQRERPLKGHEKSPELLLELFEEGTRRLVDLLPKIFDGSISSSIAGITVVQDDSKATAAPKIASEESKLNFSTMTASTVHNKVRAFSGWPGTWAKFAYKVDNTTAVVGGGVGVGVGEEIVEVKIITTAVASSGSGGNASNGDISSQRQAVKLKKGSKEYSLEIVCSDGSVLSISELQPKHKKVMSVKAFVNGFRGNITSLKYVN